MEFGTAYAVVISVHVVSRDPFSTGTDCRYERRRLVNDAQLTKGVRLTVYFDSTHNTACHGFAFRLFTDHM